MKYTGWWGFYDLNPTNNVPRRFDGETGLASGSSGLLLLRRPQARSGQRHVTHYADKFGRHELKFGAEIERSTTRDRYGYTDGVYFYDYGGVPYYAYSYGYDISAKNTRQSLFAQDAWHVGNRLTVNPGVRGDLIQGGGPIGRQRLQQQQLGAAPRLRVRSDRRQPHASSKAPTAATTRARRRSSSSRRCPERPTTSPTTSTPTTRWDRSADVKPAVLYKVADDIKHPAVDEATIGFERALSGSMRLSVTGIWRDNKNFVNSVSPSATLGQPAADDRPRHDREPLPWNNRTASNTDYLIRNIQGFQYRDPNGNVHRHGGSIPPVSRVDGGAEQAVHEPLAGAGLLRLCQGHRQRRQHQLGAGRDQQFETPNLALVNAEGPGEQYADPRVQAARAATRSPRSRPRSAPTSSARAGCPTGGSSSSRAARSIPPAPRANTAAC